MKHIKTAEEKLSEVLDIEISKHEPPSEVVVHEVRGIKINRKDAVRHDFNASRKNMKELIKAGFDALDGIMRVAEAGDSPRAYEVASILIKTLSEVNGDLMNLHKTTADALGANKAVKTTTNNSIFVGSTKDLQNIINQSRSQLKAINVNEELNDDQG